MRILLFSLALVLTNSIFSQEKDSTITLRETDTMKIVIKERKPRFPNGQKGMVSFIRKNLIIPKKIKKDKIKGTVLIGFAIDKTGKVVDIKVLQSLREDLDNLAIELMKKMPLWEPGIIRGFKVKVGGKKLPFRFNLPMK